MVDRGGTAKTLMEECESGRIGRSRKPLWSQGHRGFESHLLRFVMSQDIVDTRTHDLAIRSRSGRGVHLATSSAAPGVTQERV